MIQGRSLTAQEDKINVYEHRVSPGMVRKMGIGVLLFAFTIIINVIARGAVERSARRKRGA